MAKKKKKNLGLIKYLPLALTIVAIALVLFLEAVKFTGVRTGYESAFTGLQVLFGYTKEAGSVVTIKTEYLAFSIMALIAVLLPVIGSILQLSKGKLFKLIGAVVCLAGTVLMFLIPNFVVFASAGMEALYSLLDAGLGIGAILGGIASGLATCAIVYQLIKK